MVEKIIIPGTNIVDFSRYQQGRHSNAKGDFGCNATALSAPVCRHCGAALLEGENEDDCSSIGASRRFYAE
jgi:hypothetical protein